MLPIHLICISYYRKFSHSRCLPNITWVSFTPISITEFIEIVKMVTMYWTEFTKIVKMVKYNDK